MDIKITSVITPYENGVASAEGRQMFSETAKGRLVFDENGGSLTYSQEKDGDTVDTVLAFPLSRDRLTLTRKGAIKSHVVLEAETPHDSVYEIPPYRFPMTATLTSLDNGLSVEGGKLRLSYKMILGGEEQTVSLLVTVTKER